MRILQHARSTRSLLLAVATAAVLSACGVTPAEDDASKSPEKASHVDLGAIAVDRKAQALLPKAVRASASLKVATELDWPPFSYKAADGRPTGVDITLIEAVGRKLGLAVDITDLGATTIIPSVQNGRFDVAVSQLVTTPERRRAVNFVDYIKNTLGLIVRKGDVDKVSPTDLCGHDFVATQGTGPLAFGRQYSHDECVGKGRPPIRFQVYSDSASTILALGNGRGDGFLSNRAVGVHLAKTSDKKLVMDSGTVPGSTTLSGIAYAKKADGVGAAVQAALRSLVDDGVYTEILTRWGIRDQALTKAEMRDEASR